MTVTTAVGGDPRNMAALVTISRGVNSHLSDYYARLQEKQP